jgi:TetR/AcrR family fatty acid metabolism transcriptional regulator
MARPPAREAAAHPSEEKYKRILDAALHLFARHGYHEAKMAEIARIAGVGSGTIYLYFKNKDDLLISVFESHLEEIIARLRAQMAAARGAWAKIECFVRFHLSLALDPDLNAFITIEVRRSARFIKAQANQRFTEYLNMLGDALKEAKAEGLYPPELRTGVMKHLIFGALDHGSMVWVTNPHRRPEDLIAVGTQLLSMIRPGAYPRVHPSLRPSVQEQ